MQASRLPAALLITSSVFLLHCSGDDTPGDGNNAGTSSAMAGTTSGAGKGGSAGTGTGGTGGSAAGTGGSAGPAGSGGTSAGAGGTGATGAGGTGATGAGGMTGSTGGMSGSGTAGSGMAGSGMTGAGGNAAGASGAGGAPGGSGGRAAGGTGMGGSSSGAMTLTSTAIMEGGMFPENNTCNGDDKSPDLTWTPGPSGTMSYAVILLDTSLAPPLNHWVMWDIPATVTTLPSGLDTTAMPSMPAGAKQKAFQGNGYRGPCPPSGDHLYTFTVYALPVATLSAAMTSEQTSALAVDVMNASPLATASLSAHSLGGN